MRGVNKVILIGNLGQEPALRYFGDGTACCSLSLATNEAWRDDKGNKQQKTEWHRISVFRRLAEVCAQYLHKGSHVYIEGKLKTRSYEKDGQTRYITEIVCNEMQMLDSRSGQQGNGAAGNGGSTIPPPESGSQPGIASGQQPAADEDIPF